MKSVDKAKLWGWLAVMLFLVWLGLAVPVAIASGDCKGHSCNDVNVGGDTVNVGGDTITNTIGDTNVPVNVTTGDMVGGNTSLSNNSKALALSNVLGDVDIAGCLGSTQWATPVFSKQKLTINWPCMATFYLNNNMPDLAAVAICNTEIRKEFASEDECRAAHDFEEMIEEAVIVMSESKDEDEVEYLREELEQQSMLQADLEAKVQNLERSKRVVIQQPYLNDEQRAKLRELKQ